MWKATEDLDDFYEIKPECKDEVPKTRFKSKAGKTLSARKWHSTFSPEGYLDIAKVLRRIQRGGVHPSIRGEVWEFLLGCFDPKSNFEERDDQRQHRREQYGMWKAECQRMESTIGSGRIITSPIITADGLPVIQEPSASTEQNSHRRTLSDMLEIQHFYPNSELQEKISFDQHTELDDHMISDSLDNKIIQWKLTLHQIGLDVVRTDRTLVFYEKEDNLAKLWDVLAVYAWIDNSTGYCQGMSDLCSPMIILLENESDAFWCFERLMRRLRGNFRTTSSSIGVQTQLQELASIIQVVDPKLHQHLDMLDGGEYLFAFRMLMVLFRREFSFGDLLYLWELMWAMEYNPNIFSLYEESSNSTTDRSVGVKGNEKLLKQCGKFEKKNMQRGSKDQHDSSISVYLVASVLETRSRRLLQEAKGLDDVVNILSDITGNLDAKKACNDALKLHKKFLNKTKK